MPRAGVDRMAPAGLKADALGGEPMVAGAAVRPADIRAGCPRIRPKPCSCGQTTTCPAPARGRFDLAALVANPGCGRSSNENRPGGEAGAVLVFQARKASNASAFRTARAVAAALSGTTARAAAIAGRPFTIALRAAFNVRLRTTCGGVIGAALAVSAAALPAPPQRGSAWARRGVYACRDIRKICASGDRWPRSSTTRVRVRPDRRICRTSLPSSPSRALYRVADRPR